MNSKQRRTISRKFPYIATYTPKNVYIANEVYDWCNNNFGNNWTRKYEWQDNLLVFSFTKPEHRNWFIIRWGSCV